MLTGEGDEPVVREAPEAVRDRRCVAAKEGSDPVREVAQDRSDPEEEEDPQAAAQGPTRSQSVYQDT